MNKPDPDTLLQRAREAQFGMMTDQILQLQVMLDLAKMRIAELEAGQKGKK